MSVDKNFLFPGGRRVCAEEAERKGGPPKEEPPPQETKVGMEQEGKLIHLDALTLLLCVVSRQLQVSNFSIWEN